MQSLWTMRSCVPLHQHRFLHLHWILLCCRPALLRLVPTKPTLFSANLQKAVSEFECVRKQCKYTKALCIDHIMQLFPSFYTTNLLLYPTKPLPQVPSEQNRMSLPLQIKFRSQDKTHTL